MRRILLSAFLLFAALAVFSCQASKKNNNVTTGTSGDAGSAGNTGGAGASGSAGSSGQGGLGGDIGVGGTSTGCPQSCTADLKNVIDCNGQVITTCPTDQGCANGKCIPDPCEAAKQSSSSYGCDYWSLKTDIIDEATGACFAAFIANTWDSNVHIQVEYNGQQLSTDNFVRMPSGQGQGLQYALYDSSIGVPPGQVAILFLSREPNGTLPDCPAPAAIQGNSGVNGTGRGHAFHVTTDKPVVAYQILPYGGGSSAATSATLLLPTSVWDTNYVAINAYPQSQIAPAYPSLNLLANEDGTDVTVLPKVPIDGGPGVAPAGANTPVVYHLNRGEYVQITQGPELTGSPIQSNKPIGMWGGASCLNVPVDQYACDTAQQQIPPVKAMGNEYVATRYRDRQGGGGVESPPWRIIGMVDGTQLMYEPGPPAGAPSSLNLGDVFEFNDPGPYTVRSQDADHPFYVASYMTGGQNFGGEGDAEWVNVIPSAQYLDSYVLFTDPTYSETELVVVRRPSKDGVFADVVLDCAGPLTNWQPIGNYQWTRVDLVTGDFQDVGNCSNGRHEIKSDLPFGVTVWGWGGPAAQFFTQYVSYAYPAGASVAKINEVVVVPEPK